MNMFVFVLILKLLKIYHSFNFQNSPAMKMNSTVLSPQFYFILSLVLLDIHTITFKKITIS